jgi:hypothetical protein
MSESEHDKAVAMSELTGKPVAAMENLLAAMSVDAEHPSVREPQRYDLEYYERMLRANAATGHLMSSIRWGFIAPALKGNERPTVLDYGAGLGFFRAYRPANVEVDSHDINPFCPKTGIKRSLYDLVCLWDVLEHIKDDREIAAALGHGRWIALSVPIRPSGIARETWKHTKPGEHVREFTVESLKALMKANGFDLVAHGMPECPPREDIHSFLFRKRRKIVLANRFNPGDQIAMTRALIDLKAAFPSWQIDVRTPGRWVGRTSELYLGCPHITPLRDDDPEVERIQMEYKAIRQSNAQHIHYTEAWRKDLERQLGVDIPSTGFFPRLWPLPEERKRPEGLPERYWVIATGWRPDCILKRYPKWADVGRLWRERFDGEVGLVQVGHPSTQHDDVPDALDWRGKTTQRQLIQLVLHAEGVLCNLSGPYLYAVALDKPCVCVAGGREPPQWQDYPTVRLLHTIGQLPCCRNGGCWKSKGCVNMADETAKCMALITPERVVAAAMDYYAGGVLPKLERKVTA